jgi:hypothetical protein
MKIKFYILIILTILFVLAIKLECRAQTNTNVPAIPPPAQQESTAQDIAKVFNDFGINVNVSSIGGVLFLIYYGSKILRNKTPLGNGMIGNILSSVVNAEQKTLPPKP